MKSYSQAGQDIFVMETLGQRLGLFLDIGAHHPTNLSNTAALEEAGWIGWLVERDPHLCRLLRNGRKGSVIEGDATKIDWSFLPSEMEYLSLDVDELSLDVLQALPLDRVRFKTITFEHNSYMEGDRMRAPQRKLLSSLGYKLVKPDVVFDGNAFEDWWIDP